MKTITKLSLTLIALIVILISCNKKKNNPVPLPPVVHNPDTTTQYANITVDNGVQTNLLVSDFSATQSGGLLHINLNYNNADTSGVYITLVIPNGVQHTSGVYFINHPSSTTANVSNANYYKNTTQHYCTGCVSSDKNGSVQLMQDISTGYIKGDYNINFDTYVLSGTFNIKLE